MNSEALYVAAIHIYVTIAVAAALTTWLLGFYVKRFGSTYLKHWTQSFFWLATAYAIAAFSLWTVGKFPVDSALRLALTFFGLLSFILHAFWLLLGASEIGSAPRNVVMTVYWSVIGIIFFTAIITIAFAFSWSGAGLEDAAKWRFFLRVQLRQILVGLAFCVAAWLFLRRGSWQASIGALIAAGAMVFFGLLQFGQLGLNLGFPTFMLDHPNIVHAVQLAEFVALVAIGLGLSNWLLLEESMRADAADQQVAFHETHDPKTALPRRNEIFRRLDHLIKPGFGEDQQVVVAHVGYPRLEIVRQRYGRLVAEQAMLDVSDRLRSLVITGGFVGRVSGHEFVLVQPLSRGASPDKLLEQLESRLTAPMLLDGETVRPKPVIGVAVAPDDCDSAGELLSKAELTFAEARTVRLAALRYTQQIGELAARRTRLERDIGNAISNHQLEVWYQPLVANHPDQRIIMGAEALVRWRHPELGIVMPGEFLHIAEQENLAYQLDLSVLSMVLENATSLATSNTPDQFILAANLTPSTFLDHRFRDDLERLQFRDLDPRFRMVLEITEQTAVADIERTRQVGEHLREQGIALALDDFGSGFSSLSHLQSLPIDLVKFDRAFLLEALGASNESQLMSGLIPILHSLNLSVIVEGVEEQDQAAALAAMNMDFLQGFYFYSPMQLDQLKHQMRTRETA